jgi:putative oxygen-independent coproporphyrinogen III oxidase
VAGIYIHIPFCKKRCHYCDFYSCVDSSFINPFITAVQREIEQSIGYFETDDNTVKTIYFGGGTPSVLSIQQISSILSSILKNFKIDNNPEITIEVNPDDIDINYLKDLRASGFNRTSIGVQSFNDNYLKLMNRRHNTDQAKRSVGHSLNAGIDNINIDLIYGLPGMTNKEWEETLNTAFSLPIKHLSAYHLGIEEHTVFYKWNEEGKIKPVLEETSFEQFKLLNEIAIDKGFEHYEISNLALSGYQSRHNSAYWDNNPYLGIGPAAHSYNGQTRKWNISDVKTYIEKIGKNEKYWEFEVLSPKELFNEYILTHLRMRKGIDFTKFETMFGHQHYQTILNKSQQFIKNGFAEITNDYLKLNLNGWFISDTIISELMV